MASSYALVCVFLLATLCACGGGGGEGESDGVNQTPSSSTGPSPAEAVSAWTSGGAFGLTGGGIPNSQSLAIGNDGQTHLLYGSLTSVTSLMAFHKPSGGRWDTGEALGSPVTMVPPLYIPSGIPLYDRATVRVDDGGNALATWTFSDFSDANNGVSHVFFSRRDAVTGAWTSPQIVQNDALALARDVNLAVEPSGRAWAVWTERTFKDVSYLKDQYAVFAAKFDPAVGWAAPEKISADVERSIAARVTTDRHGNPRVIIAWNSPSGEWTLWAVRRSAAGTWGPLETLAQATDLRDYDLAVGATDDAVAIWREWTGPYRTGKYVIRSRHFTAGGGWEPTVELQLSSAADGYAPQLAMDDAGNAFVAWQELVGPSLYVISTARFEKSKGWTLPEVISSPSATSDDYSTFPKIASDGAGNAVAIWGKYDFTLNQTVIRGKYYSKANGWGTEETISTSFGGPWQHELAMSTQLAMSKGGYAIAVWWQPSIDNVFQPWSATRAPTP